MFMLPMQSWATFSMITYHAQDDIVTVKKTHIHDEIYVHPFNPRDLQKKLSY